MQQTTIYFLSSDKDKDFSNFLNTAIQSLFDELFLYIVSNGDHTLLGYANEQTLASLFVNGLIRRDNRENPSITAVQEYSITPGNDSPKLRPDIFIRHNQTAIWIECKYDRNNPKYNENTHFKVQEWLLWDQRSIRSQVDNYYGIEGPLINETYTMHYVATMAFKLIDANRESHLKKCEAMRIEIEGAERNCYYAVEFLQDDNGNYTNEGLEVYGTFEKRNKLNKS